MHIGLRNRAVVASAGLLFAITACGGDGGDDSDVAAPETTGATGGETENVRIMMFPGQSYRVPVEVAQQQGYFDEAGIELEIVEQPNNLQGMQGLDATEAQVGIVTVGTLGQGVQAGNEGAFFCGGIEVLQTTLVAPTDSDLPSTEDGASWEEVLQSLEGKNIGIQTPVGSGLQLIFAEALAEAGVENVNYVNIGGAFNVVQAALENGSVDVAQANPPGTQTLLNSGTAKPLLYMSEGPTAYKDFYGSAWVAPTSWLDKKPETAAAFCEAIDKALEYIKDPANEQEVAEVVASETGAAPEVAEEVVPTFEDFNTDLKPSTLQETLDAYTRLGILKTEPPATADELYVDVRE